MNDRFDHTLDDTLDTNSGANAAEVRRIEVITGVGRRRRWSTETKAGIVLESLEPGAVVSEVARRHGLSPQQLFGWRRQLGASMAAASTGPGAAALPKNAAPAFAPVLVDRAALSKRANRPSPGPGRAAASAGEIEIAIGRVIVRLKGPIETSALVAVLRAVGAVT
jgi:transposase